MGKKTKIIYLFDTKNDSVKPSEKTLLPDFQDSASYNFRFGMLRSKINDYVGALMFLNKCIEQDKTFREAYIEKCLIYFDLNEFDNAILNFFKSSIIDKEIFHEVEPLIHKSIYEYFPQCDKMKREKIINYIEHYQKILDHSNSYNNFAEKLLRLQLFDLSNEIETHDNYSKFLNLEEKKIVC